MLTDPGQEMHQQGRLCCNFISILNTQFSQKKLKSYIKVYFLLLSNEEYLFLQNEYIYSCFHQKCMIFVNIHSEDYFIIGFTVTSSLT